MTTPTDVPPQGADEAILPLAEDFPAADAALWRALVDKALKRDNAAAGLTSRTPDGLEILPLYSRADAAPTTDAGAPGEAPFVRGGSNRTDWRVGELFPNADPAHMRAAISAGLAAGTRALTIRFAAPGQSGLPVDPDKLTAVLEQLDLSGTHLTAMAGSEMLPAAAAISAAIAKAAAPPAATSLGIDPLGTLARTGALCAMSEACRFESTIPWLEHREGRQGTTLLADARIYHEAGASAAQELAALIATLVAYLRAAEADGKPPPDTLTTTTLALATDADLFTGIAKLRAARRLVWRIAEACGAGDHAGRMQLVVSTSERMMSRRDPWVNMLRTAAATAAAAMGGAHEITALPFTWPLGQPDAFARRIARNTGLVLQEEAGLGRIADPAGGAWYVESLTHQLATAAWQTFQHWEAAGGMLRALLDGRIADEISAVAEARRAALRTGHDDLTGTSAFPRLGDDGVTVAPWPPTPPLPGTTLGSPLTPIRLAAPFERLREAADASPDIPAARIFIAALGSSASNGARTAWLRNLLAAGGIAVNTSENLTSSADAGRTFADSGASVACLTGSDQTYTELAEATAMALKGAGATKVYLAGRPGAAEADLTSAEVDGFIYSGIDRIEVLERLQDDLAAAVTASGAADAGAR